jgi:hypothetical protein
VFAVGVSEDVGCFGGVDEFVGVATMVGGSVWSLRACGSSGAAVADVVVCPGPEGVSSPSAALPS